MNDDSQYEVRGRATATPRKTTIKQDLRDIGRMAVGFAKSSLSGRGGRERRQAIDDRVEKAERG